MSKPRPARPAYTSPKRYSPEQLAEASRLDQPADAEHSEKQAEDGPYFPERGITKESLLAYAAECRKKATA